MKNVQNVINPPERTITMRCRATEFGVIEETFEAAIQVRSFGKYMEIWSIPANPADYKNPPALLATKDDFYSWRSVAAWIIDEVEALGRDFRGNASISGEDGIGAEILLMSWMGNWWDLEDQTEYSDEPSAKFSTQDIAGFLVLLEERNIERLYEELHGFDDIDDRLYEIIAIFEEARELSLDVPSPELRLNDFDADTELVNQLRSRLATWVSKHRDLAAEAAKQHRKFILEKGNRVNRYLTTDGLECSISTVGAGGANYVRDSEEALDKAVAYVTESLLAELRAEGFDDLAIEMKNRARRAGRKIQ